MHKSEAPEGRQMARKISLIPRAHAPGYSLSALRDFCFSLEGGFASYEIKKNEAPPSLPMLREVTKSEKQ